MYIMSELEPMGNWARKYKERAIAEDHRECGTKNWGWGRGWRQG